MITDRHGFITLMKRGQTGRDSVEVESFVFAFTTLGCWYEATAKNAKRGDFSVSFATQTRLRNRKTEQPSKNSRSGARGQSP